VKVAILGGGVCGLGAAYRLCKAGVDCTVIEKEPEVGGIAGCFKVKDFWIEKYYHHMFKTDNVLLGLAGELGLGDRIVWRESKTAFFHKGRLYPFSSPVDLIRFKPLKMADRLRLGLNVLSLGEEAGLDAQSAEDWLKGRWSEDIYRVMFKPLLKTKFGIEMGSASAAFVHGRLKARANSRKSGRELLGYVKGSFRELTEAMASRLKEAGCKILTNTEAVGLEKKGGAFSVRTKKGVIDADVVLSTLPLSALWNIAKFRLDEKVKNIKYRAVVCATFGLNGRLTDYYWTNIIDEDMPFGAVIEHTNWMDSRDYGGDSIIHVVNYCSEKDAIYRMKDAGLVSLFLKSLEKIKPGFGKADVKWHKISRDAYATPLFEKGYGKKIPAIKTGVKGLYLAGSFQVYPHSRNVNNIIEKGFTAAETILEDART
jgi:protoporphyrinogen oxidase